MKLLQKILNRFNGLHYPQEYLCFAKESLTDTLHVYLTNKEQVIRNISDTHLFVGYNPLILALFDIKIVSPEQLTTIDIIFTTKPMRPNETFSLKDAIASLTLQKINQQATGDDSIYFFEGLKGQHGFLSPFHQWVIGLNNRLSNKKPGNVYLQDNLYKQVQIAYAIPRNIALITVGENGRYNLFPTDLHGEASNDHYIISLRHEGKACCQVERAGRILVSGINSQFYKSAYALGKNHMQEPREKSAFPFSSDISANLHLPIPQSALVCRELELIESFTHGIHKLLLLKIVHQQAANEAPATLAHVHNCYATWRYKQGLTSNFLLR